jgi:Flp pilus assembly protein TadG
MSSVLLGEVISKKGQAAVEFALIVLAFLLLLFALRQMSLVIYTYNTISFATHQAVRYAAVHGPNRTPTVQSSDMKTFILNHTTTLIPAKLTVNLTWPADRTLPIQQDALVATSYDYSFRIPFMSSVTLALTSTSQMLVEQ